MSAARAVTALLAALLLAFAVRAGADERLLVTVGEVTATSAVVWARGGATTARVAIAPAGQPVSPAGEIGLAAATDRSGKLLVTALAPGTRYHYRVTTGAQIVEGQFVTAPPPDVAAATTFAWSGDLGGGGFCRRVDDGYPIFRPLAARRPDFFLFVGDTIYADRSCNRPDSVPGSNFIATTLPTLHAKHRYNRADAAVQEAFRVTSVYAIWDDHEVLNDFAGTTERLMPLGRQAFLDYFPIIPPADAPTRLHRRVRWGKLLEVFILDTRQYRSDNGLIDGPAKTMLGAAQRDWLVDAAATSDAKWKVVVSSVPLALPTGRRGRRDSWSSANVYGTPEPGAGFATERDRILASLRDRGVKNLVVVTADVHHAEIIRHEPHPGFVLHELIAGPLSASLGTPRPLDDTMRPVSLWARGGINNFGEVLVEPGRLVVRYVAEDGAVLHERVIQGD